MKAATLAGSWDQMNQIGYYGNVFVRMHGLMKAGQVHDGHTHYFDHVTMLFAGSLKVRWRKHKDGDLSKELLAFGEKTFTAPTFITIDKDTMHEITALEDGTLWACVYALPEGFNGDPGAFHSERNTPYV